jgi:hypothetical protein
MRNTPVAVLAIGRPKLFNRLRRTPAPVAEASVS